MSQQHHKRGQKPGLVSRLRKNCLFSRKRLFEEISMLKYLELQSTCCEGQINGKTVGGCTAHAAKCGASKGVFIRLRKCDVVLITDLSRGKVIYLKI